MMIAKAYISLRCQPDMPIAACVTATAPIADVALPVNPAN
jgi:hypothetical protein